MSWMILQRILIQSLIAYLNLQGLLFTYLVVLLKKYK